MAITSIQTGTRILRRDQYWATNAKSNATSTYRSKKSPVNPPALLDSPAATNANRPNAMRAQATRRTRWSFSATLRGISTTLSRHFRLARWAADISACSLSCNGRDEPRNWDWPVGQGLTDGG